MSAGDLERFEAAAGGLLGELEYGRAVPEPPLERLESASKMRGLVVRDTRGPAWVGTKSECSRMS